ncbi:mannosyltransferase [Sphingomonas sp. HF-S4]|uniref:Mannosyltransferase n=1 Tax=Sphingomonas agrestis TaxID=3080540 RepID=A0ABU3YDK5_9SPHN|nr:glycosyltransferase [Sphingomonas sp. HF-S4]MDV3459278.1 mannosyltransferase [Sphingomonas sp. HF-S4]
MIPKLMHFIWVGDEGKCPTNCMDTWRALNPDWEFLLWGNDDLASQDWFNREHIAAMYDVELNGVADMMRWEILHAKGGVVVDADSIARRPLDDHLLDCEAFACWESEIARPGLIAAGYFGCEAGNPFVEQIIRDIHDEPSVTHAKAWKTVGPQRLTDSYRKYGYSKLRVYPSHYFIPRHFTGLEYDGNDPVYADQLWGSTRRAYDEIHALDVTAQAELTPPKPRIVAPAPSSAPTPGVSPVEAGNAPYFVQRVQVSSELVGLGRGSVLRNFCAGKRVLHVGCADWPITDINTSLHLGLEPVCAQLDGVDPHTEALDQLAPHVKGRLFSSLSEATDSYDLVLVPEVMEHVANVSDFLAELQAIDAGAFLISVPDAFQCRARHFDYLGDSETFVEVVHPDHNAWYTPYTFANTIQKYSALRLEKMWFFNRISLLALLSKEQLRMAA